MQLARVIGTVVAAQKAAGLEGVRLLVVQPLQRSGAPSGAPVVAADGTITKVRYKDPESGKVGEFVPNQAQERQPAAGPFQPPTAAEQGSVTKNQERVTVKAGTFTAEHTSYTDSQNAYSSELWTSDEVPGRLVKYLTKNLQSGDVAEGDLVKIEHGVSTSLESY